MSRSSVHVRLPRDLLEELRAASDAQDVSLNTLLIGLLAGSLGWSLDPHIRQARAAGTAGPESTNVPRGNAMGDSDGTATGPIPHRNLPLVHVERLQENGEPFKVRELLPELIRNGWRRGRSDRARSIDVRLYFRTKPNGDEWGELAIIDRETGKLVKVEGEDYVGLPVHSSEALQWFVSELVYEGWTQHRAARQ
jgi:hypothetical protein